MNNCALNAALFNANLRLRRPHFRDFELFSVANYRIVQVLSRLVRHALFLDLSCFNS